VWVADADEAAAKVRAAGGSVLSEPADVGDTGRTALCADSEGAAFTASKFVPGNKSAAESGSAANSA
jgi:predicted enzyme related to lactoylglutathione lyase